jgi:hypothetical protein
VFVISLTYFIEDYIRAPEERHRDEGFFRVYEKLGPDAKEQLHKILKTFKKDA